MLYTPQLTLNKPLKLKMLIPSPTNKLMKTTL